MNDKQLCVLEVIFATKQQGLGLKKKDKITEFVCSPLRLLVLKDYQII